MKDEKKGSDLVVKRWLKELDLADREEKDWNKDATEALKVYSGEVYSGTGDDKRRKDTFNILWSNVEILRPSLYNSTPRPDIRRRFKDKDPLGKAVSELLERAITYTVDCADFDHTMIAAVLDELLPGRGVTRVRYTPTIAQSDEDPDGETSEEVIYEEVGFEQVQWNRFKRGAGSTWDDVPWISFEHRLDEDEVEDKFPEFADKVQYDCTESDDSEAENEDEDKQFERCKVYEIWDKDERQVIFIAPSYKDAPLAIEDDPLELKDFWPIPRPLMSIENSTTLVPSTDYSMYETLAKELEKVTTRIGMILKGLRIRGIYDARLPEIQDLFDAGDNKYVPSNDVAALIEAGGLDKAIWSLPIGDYAVVLTNLYQYRQTLIQSIYEITGISDVLRGATNPNETLGAQQIKANFGTQRLQKRQMEVQRYARDLIRIATEIISEKFSPDTLSLMTGLKFPTNEQKQQAQMQIQMAQQQAQMTGQPPQIPPEVQQMLSSPSWEDIKEVITSDALREFRIDIETDSTIQAQQQEDQKNITELLSGITNFMGTMAPAIQTGFVTVDVAKTMLLAAVRRFKLGREVEDALDSIEAPKDQPNPEAEAMKAQQQGEQARMQMEGQKMQMEGQKSQQMMQMEAQKMQIETQKSQAEMQIKQAEQQIKAEEVQLKAREIALKESELAWKQQTALQEAELKSRSEIERENIKASASLEMARISATGQEAASRASREPAEMPEFDWAPFESAITEIKASIEDMKEKEAGEIFNMKPDEMQEVKAKIESVSKQVEESERKRTEIQDKIFKYIEKQGGKDAEFVRGLD